MDRGSGTKGQKSRPAEHGSLYIELEISDQRKSRWGRNRRNRVTLGKKSFYYIDLQVTDYRYTDKVVTRVCVTTKDRKCVKGVAGNFFSKFFSGYI